ncbi:hypothetical protein [Arhodomonas sp. AD133]|uniref:hypothetical protein n=1 Tax=Arhodomonas sp. AD133 TaxID=3415009 RepID=UPI003EC0DFFB
MFIQYARKVVGAVVVIVPLLLWADVSQPPSDSPHGRSVQGVSVYFSVIPAEIIRQRFERSSSERAMHGGVPEAPHVHHVMVALFETATDERITDATVYARILLPESHAPAPKKRRLEAMHVAGTTTYGNYFVLGTIATYNIEVIIDLPRHPGIRTSFRYEHTAGTSHL